MRPWQSTNSFKSFGMLQWTLVVVFGIAGAVGAISDRSGDAACIFEGSLPMPGRFLISNDAHCEGTNLIEDLPNGKNST